MHKYFINYAHNGFKESQKTGLDKAKSLGFETKGYSINDISEDFIKKNSSIFEKSRGAGYWIWKPYIILDMLSRIEVGDYLIYMDSGAYLIKDPQDYLETIDESGILAFSLIHKNSTWCKRDVFDHIFNGEYDYFDKEIMCASYIFLKKNDRSISFVENWLNLCQDFHLITDEPSNSPNYNDFKEHRHDQSIYSLLIYKDNLKFIPDISQWRSDFGLDPSERIIEHHRYRH